MVTIQCNYLNTDEERKKERKENKKKGKIKVGNINYTN